MYDGEEYLILYPNLRKWINECAICHIKGYKPAMTENMYPYPSVNTNKLRYYFKPLNLNEEGICESCMKKKEMHSLEVN